MLPFLEIENDGDDNDEKKAWATLTFEDNYPVLPERPQDASLPDLKRVSRRQSRDLYDIPECVGRGPRCRLGGWMCSVREIPCGGREGSCSMKAHDDRSWADS